MSLRGKARLVKRESPLNRYYLLPPGAAPAGLLPWASLGYMQSAHPSGRKGGRLPVEAQSEAYTFFMVLTCCCKSSTMLAKRLSERSAMGKVLLI